MGNAKSAVTQPDGVDTTYRWPFLKQVSTIRLILGPLTAILLWIGGLQMLTSLSAPVGLILLVFAFPTTLLEFSWLISKCTFCPPEGPFCKVWHFFLRLDTWKRGVFYIICTVVCFILTSFGVFAGICAVCFLILAICYTLKTFQHTPPEQVAAAGLSYAGNMATQQPPPNIPAYGAGMNDPNRFSTIPP